MKIQNKLQTKNIKKIKNIENEAKEIDTALQGATAETELTYNTMSHGTHYTEATGLVATDAMLATASTTTATLATAGLTLGTIGWGALGVVAVGGAVAAAAGGGGSSNGGSKGQLATLSDPTATAANIALVTPDILFSIDEERMARDVYDALYIQTGLKIFDNISDSEQKHYDAVLNSAINLGIDTSALLTTPGVYLNPEIQALYDDLMALGSQSTADALNVGKMIEEVDITDLKEMIDSSPITSLDSVYTNLLNGSYNHLDAFNAQIAII